MIHVSRVAYDSSVLTALTTLLALAVLTALLAPAALMALATLRAGIPSTESNIAIVTATYHYNSPV